MDFLFIIIDQCQRKIIGRNLSLPIDQTTNFSTTMKIRFHTSKTNSQNAIHMKPNLIYNLLQNVLKLQKGREEEECKTNKQKMKILWINSSHKSLNSLRCSSWTKNKNHLKLPYIARKNKLSILTRKRITLCQPARRKVKMYQAW